MRAFFADADYRLKMLHKSWIVFQVAPETIGFRSRFVHRDCRFERGTILWLLVRSGNAHGLICRAIAGETPVNQGATAEHKQQVAKRATQTVESQRPATNHREHAFEAPHVDLRVGGQVVFGVLRLRRPGDSCCVF